MCVHDAVKCIKPANFLLSARGCKPKWCEPKICKWLKGSGAHRALRAASKDEGIVRFASKDDYVAKAQLVLLQHVCTPLYEIHPALVVDPKAKLEIVTDAVCVLSHESGTLRLQ
jgi:hypothetical protein